MTYRTITLLDRLKPHYSEKLSDKNIQHPTVVGRIIDALHPPRKCIPVEEFQNQQYPVQYT